MRLFGWVIERETEVKARDTRWFTRGYDCGWSSAMDEAEAQMKKAGINVLRASPELIEKLKLGKVA
jgi:hypothetical protein